MIDDSLKRPEDEFKGTRCEVCQFANIFLNYCPGIYSTWNRRLPSHLPFNRSLKKGRMMSVFPLVFLEVLVLQMTHKLRELLLL